MIKILKILIPNTKEKSTNNHNIVVDIYKFFFDREADENGLKHYVRELKNGKNVFEILTDFSNSEEYLNRVEKSNSGSIDTKDVFNGIQLHDEEMVKSICDTDTSVSNNIFIDSIGVKVSPEYYPWIADKIGKRSTNVPIPNDGYFAEGIEYVALAHAFKLLESRQKFTVVEIGAGWGPWISAATVVARRLGYAQINIAAFEADESRYNAMRSHLSLNKIISVDSPSKGTIPGLRWQLFNAAADAEDKILYWPIDHGIEDAGMATATSPTDVDYRGKKTTYKEIRALDIRTALEDFSVIDFLHIDIQGSEYELINNTIDFIEKTVRFVFIGTHSRKIEGDLIFELLERGWKLLRERPCQFTPTENIPSLTGMTYVDGGQFWQTTYK
jgi:FkbM family methyltransferase